MKIKNVAVMSLVAVLCLSAISCGNSESAKQDTYSVPKEATPIPTETTMTENETLMVEESAVETTTVVTTTETTTEVSSEAGDNSGGNSNSDSEDSGGNEGGGSENASEEPDLDKRTSRFDLSWFKVYGKGDSDNYSLRDTAVFDELTNEMHLNRYGDFMEISGETYKGYLTEQFGFSGQAYWLRGEGGSKCFIEQDSDGNVTAIAFSNIHDDYAMKFVDIVNYGSSENTEALGEFQGMLGHTEEGETVDPVILRSGDGKCETWVWNDGTYSIALEIVYGENGASDALKTVMIYNNHRNKQ